MIYNSKRWFQDIDRVSERLSGLPQLNGKSVMITGAAGLVCSAVVDILIRYNETNNDIIDIFAAGRWPSEMQGRFGVYYDKPYFHYVEYDAAKPVNPAFPSVDYIIHGASNASPEMIVREPVETMLSNISGLEQLLRFAAEKSVKRLLYISSSEVYGIKNSIDPFSEEDYGFIDLLKPRNSYSSAKRAAETLCVSFAEEYGTETVIVRPGHIYGPTASPLDNRVSSAFAYSAARGEDLILKSDGSQLRSYCYCLDCASAILNVLINGKNKEAYNISNSDSVITIRQMAELLAKAGGVNVSFDVASETDKKGFNPMSNSSLKSDKLESLGWHGYFDARTGLSHTVEILREIMTSETL